MVKERKDIVFYIILYPLNFHKDAYWKSKSIVCMGYITRGRGLTIHAVGCPNLDALDYDRDRLIDVEWDFTTPSTHPVKVSVVAVDKPGVLANVSSSISGAEANIKRAEIATGEDRKAILNFVVGVQGTAHLDRVLKAIEKVEGVITARRVRAWHD